MYGTLDFLYLFVAAKFTLNNSVFLNCLLFYQAGLIRINPPGKSQNNPLEGDFFLKTAEK